MFWPTINSYKRLVDGFWAPVKPTWGIDNRTASFRVIAGSPKATRLETRCPGADVNPYLAMAAVIAAGLHGVEQGLELEAPYSGNAYLATDKPRLPTTLREARELFADSAVAKAAFGADVVAHYLNAADVELAAFDSAVTDWERVRGFERL